MKKVVIDMDDTIVNLKDEIKAILKTDYGIELSTAEMTKYWLEDIFCNRFWFSKETSKRLINNDIFSRPGFWKNLLPNPNSIETIKWLCKHYLVIISSKIPENASDYGQIYTEKLWWLKYHFGYQMDFGKIFFFPTHWKQKKAVLAIDGGILIDDKPNEILEAIKHSVQAIVFDQQWNRMNFGLAPDVFRVHNWKDIRTWFEIDLIV